MLPAKVGDVMASTIPKYNCRCCFRLYTTDPLRATCLHAQTEKKTNSQRKPYVN